MIFLLAFIAGIPLFYLSRFFPWSTAVFSTTLLLYLAVGRRYAVVLLMALGALYAFQRHAPATEPGPAPGITWARGYVGSPPVAVRGGFSQEFRMGGGADAGRVEVLSERELEVGGAYLLKLRVLTPEERKNPDARPGKPYAVVLEGEELGGEGAGSPSVAVNRMRQRVNGCIREGLSPEAASLVMAVTTGQRAEIPHELRDAFNSAGLAHLLSISGTHFGLFGVLVFGIIRLGIKYLPRRAIERVAFYLTPTEAAALLSLPFMLFYLGLSGASIPSIRAFIMMSLFLLGLLVSRRGHWLNFLLAAALLLVLWEPGIIFSLSFQLSFTAVLFIGAVTKGREAEPTSPRRGWAALLKGYIGKSLAITLAASMGVLPLVAYHFHYVSLVSPAANLVVTPLVGFVLVPLSILGACLSLLAGGYATGLLVEPVARAVIWLAGAFASLPCASVKTPHFPLALIAAFYAGALIWPLRRGCGLLLALAPAIVYIALALSAERPLRVTFLDVGRADASVVELPDGKVVVVDTGKRGREVADYLRYRGIGEIDALVLTHGHRDHTGGAGWLAGRFKVGEVWDSGRLEYPDEVFDAPIRGLRRGDVVEGEGYVIYVLHPYPGFYTSEGGKNTSINNGSLVLRLVGRERSFLLTGDIEREAVEDILHLGARLRSDLLKVPHHGLTRAGREALLEAVSPEAAVISSPWPGPDMGGFGGRKVFVTGRDGAVKVEEKGEGFLVEPYLESVIRTTGGDLREEMRNLKRLFTAW